MQLHLNNRPDLLLVRSCNAEPAPDGDSQSGAGMANTFRIRVGETDYRQSIILTSRSVEMWDVATAEALTRGHFEHLATFETEVVILGTGSTIVFPDPALTRPLIARGVGLEVMDTSAACRTYNILAGDGRPCIAAVIA